MKDKAWFELWDKTHSSFYWFFIKYGYELEWNVIIMWREVYNRSEMITLMNKVWFELPDHIFNIRVNPKGWSEFLALIEE